MTTPQATPPVLVANARRNRLMLTFGFAVAVMLGSAALIFLALTMNVNGPDAFGVHLIAAAVASIPGLTLSVLARACWRRLRLTKPEITIGPDGVYSWHWSDKVIPWSNIAGANAHSRQKIVSLKLINLALDPPRKMRSKLFSKNRDSLEGINRQMKNPALAVAAVVASPAGALGVMVVSGLPDSRDPWLIAENTDTHVHALSEAISAWLAVPQPA